MTPPTPSNRRHDLDALRAAAMLLGIAYHGILSFASDFGWMVQDRSQNQGSFVFQAFVHGFRMQLFMLLSGFFTAMLWRQKGLKALLWQRFQRVLVPCLLGLITIVPAVIGASTLTGKWRAESAQKAARLESTTNSVWVAIGQGDTQALASHLQQGASLTNLHPTFRVPPLTWAVLSGQQESARLLLERGADVSGRNLDGNTALHGAAFLGRVEMFELLLRSGADPQVRNPNGETALVSAQTDYGVVEYIAGILGLTVDRAQVTEGRKVIVTRLKGLGVSETGGSGGATPAWRKVYGFLTGVPLFGVLWFLWFLCWLVALFTGYAWVIDRLGWRARAHALWTSPASLLWLVPVTLIPGWFMSSGHGEFGPDTAMGIVPTPHVLGYYAVFFFFGAVYFDCEDREGRLGRGWRWLLPVALLGVFPLALEAATGRFGWRDAWLPAGWHEPVTRVAQAFYAWLMAFGCMGLFRSLITRESPRIRYLSDSAYWLYLAHLPLTILLQGVIRDWPGPGGLKWFGLTVGLIGFLLLTYQGFVRYTVIGRLLNGPRRRPGKVGEGPPPITSQAG